MADPEPTEHGGDVEETQQTEGPKALATYRRKKVMTTDLKMGGCSVQLTDWLHLNPEVFEPGSVQITVQLSYAHSHRLIDNDDGKTLHLDQTMDPRVAMVLPEGSLRTELLQLLDDVAARVSAMKAEAEGGQGTFTPRVVGE